MGMQGKFLLFNSILLGTRIASLAVGGLLRDVLVTLLLFSITGTICYCFFCLFILNKSGVTLKNMMDDMWRLAANALLPILPVVALKAFGASPMVITMACCLAALAYYAILCFRDEEIKKLLAGHAGRW